MSAYKEIAEQLLIEQPVKFKDKDGQDHEVDMDTAKQYKVDIDSGDTSDYKKAAVKAAGLDKDDTGSQDGEKEEPSGKLGGGDFERETEPEKGEKPKDAPAGAVPSGQTKFSQADRDAMASTQYGTNQPTQRDKPSGEKQKVTEKPGETKQITAAGGNGVLLSKATVGHISAHNEPGEGSVFSDAMGEDELIKAVSEIPEDFFTTGDERGPGGIHTIETDHTVGYNLVEKAKDIEKKYPNAKKIMVNKQAGYDAEKGKPIMKPVPAYIIDNDIEEFGTKQMSVIARPSNPDRMDQELQDDPEVKDNMENKKSFSVLTAFPGDPDVPPAQNWEESGHAIIIPNGGKGADKTNWVTDSSARTGKELGKNETLKINGKMYKRVQESTEDLQKEHPKKHPLRESYERIGGK
jgi:hypothetical protein